MARCSRGREGLGQRQTDTDKDSHADWAHWHKWGNRRVQTQSLLQVVNTHTTGFACTVLLSGSRWKVWHACVSASVIRTCTLESLQSNISYMHSCMSEHRFHFVSILHSKSCTVHRAYSMFFWPHQDEHAHCFWPSFLSLRHSRPPSFPLPSHLPSQHHCRDDWHGQKAYPNSSRRRSSGCNILWHTGYTRRFAVSSGRSLPRRRHRNHAANLLKCVCIPIYVKGRDAGEYVPIQCLTVRQLRCSCWLSRVTARLWMYL